MKTRFLSFSLFLSIVCFASDFTSESFAQELCIAERTTGVKGSSETITGYCKSGKIESRVGFFGSTKRLQSEFAAEAAKKGYTVVQGYLDQRYFLLAPTGTSQAVKAQNLCLAIEFENNRGAPQSVRFDCADGFEISKKAGRIEDVLRTFGGQVVYQTQIDGVELSVGAYVVQKAPKL